MRRIINTVVIIILSITTLGLLVYAFDQQMEASRQFQVAYKFADSINLTEQELSVYESEKQFAANFSALIVNDIGLSVDWYEEMLGFEVVDSTQNEERGLKQYNLKNGAERLELIEISTAVDPQGGLVKGIFKIGYSVTDFDSWLKCIEGQVSPDDVVTDPVGGKRTVVFRDPDGNRIQLFEQ